MIVQLRFRRDTAANWSRINPILADGEPGWDSTGHTFRVGDGTTRWLDLPVQSIDPTALTSLLDQINDAAEAVFAAATDAQVARDEAIAAAGVSLPLDASDPTEIINVPGVAFTLPLDASDPSEIINVPDATDEAFLLDRANHTGLDEIADVNGLTAALSSKVNVVAGARVPYVLVYTSTSQARPAGGSAILVWWIAATAGLGLPTNALGSDIVNLVAA